MAAPSISVSAVDNQLGSVNGDAVRSCFIIGHSTGGTANTIYAYGGDNIQKVKTELVKGKLVDAVAHVLTKSKGKTTVFAIPGAASTAGSSGSVTKSGSGPDVTISTGTPDDDYSMIVKIIVGGAVGTATFQVSYDGGKNYGPTYLTAATFVLDSGVTIAFAAGTYVAADTYSWTETGPINTNANIGAAIDVALASSRSASVLYVVGAAADETDAETVATTVGSKLATGLASNKFMRGFVEMPVVAASTLITGFADFEDARVVATLGYADVVNDVVNGRVDKRNIGRALVARVMRNGLSVQAMRNESDSALEPLSGLTIPEGQAASTGYHLENESPGADAGRFSYMMNLDGTLIPGRVLTMAASSSDFQLLNYGLIVDEMSRVMATALKTFTGKKLRVNAVTGYIAETEAKNIEAFLNNALKSGLVNPGHLIATSVQVNRTDNLLADNTLRVKARGIPYAYAFTITAEVGLKNPAIPQVAAAA